MPVMRLTDEVAHAGWSWVAGGVRTRVRVCAYIRDGYLGGATEVRGVRYGSSAPCCQHRLAWFLPRASKVQSLGALEAPGYSLEGETIILNLSSDFDD